jgi:4-amino-4-deoxy-L-arabinose transferase-like glycosyltransferase
MSFFQKTFSGRQLPFIILTSATVVWLLCFSLFQDGMFIDGIQYAAVARNLARGVGTFWNPVLAQNSVAGLNSFHEHPPLVFFLQSLFFKIFGFNNIYPERIYCLITFLLAAVFMALIWRRANEGELKQLWWLPVFLWVIMPVVFWAYTNDIQENTMGVFTTAAVYFFLRATGAGSVLRSFAFYLGCISVLMAGFCKGVPGLFPVAFFFIYWLVTRKIKFQSAISGSLIAVALMALAVWVVLQNEEAYTAMHAWLFDRMFKRISSDPTEDSHFYILIGLFTEQLPSLVGVVIALGVFKWKGIKNEINTGYVALFLLLGLSGSLPLMLTRVQRNFYFIPALPMFAIAWALLIAHGFSCVTEQLDKSLNLKKGIAAFACIGLITGAAFTFAFAGKPKRDKQMLQDVYSIQKLVKPNSFISVSSDIMWADWSFRCYMMRYDEISFSNTDTCHYFLSKPGDRIPERFMPTEARLNLYQLYKVK